MALAESRKRFMWSASGFPRNSRDTIILQSTRLYAMMMEGNIIQTLEDRGKSAVKPMIVGDSAFPFHTWLMKLYANAVPTPQQQNINFRMSCARMVVEGAFGQLKGRWRVLMRKSECGEETLKLMSHACCSAQYLHRYG